MGTHRNVQVSMSFKCSQPGMNWEPKALEGNEVHINSIWREHVTKEGHGRVQKDKFTLNPMPSLDLNNGLGCRVPFVTDKVGTKPAFDPKKVDDDAEVQEAINGLVKQSGTPHEKISKPATSAHEVGWMHKPLVPANPRFHRGKSSCHMVTFADSFTL